MEGRLAMVWIGGAVRAGVKAGIAKKVLDELRKPENQRRLRVIAERVAAEVRKPENQERARQVARRVAAGAGAAAGGAGSAASRARRAVPKRRH